MYRCVGSVYHQHVKRRRGCAALLKPFSAVYISLARFGVDSNAFQLINKGNILKNNIYRIAVFPFAPDAYQHIDFLSVCRRRCGKTHLQREKKRKNHAV